jgi:hypothetical protein
MSMGPKEQQLKLLQQARLARGKQKAKATAEELRQAIADVTEKTAAKPAAKPATNAAKLKGGRPRLGKATMTSTERSRRSRERRIKNAK